MFNRRNNETITKSSRGPTVQVTWLKYIISAIKHHPISACGVLNLSSNLTVSVSISSLIDRCLGHHPWHMMTLVLTSSMLLMRKYDFGRSLIAAYLLVLNGYKNVYHLEGGLYTWFKEGLPAAAAAEEEEWDARSQCKIVALGFCSLQPLFIISFCKCLCYFTYIL